jgi:hypothetical protein
VKKSVAPGSGDKRAVRKIIAIGKNFAGDAEPLGRPGFRQDTAASAIARSRAAML